MKSLPVFLILILFSFNNFCFAATQNIKNETQEDITSIQNINRDSFSLTIANPNTVKPNRFLFELKPGETVEDYVILKNTSDIDLAFHLYAADAIKSQQGNFTIKTKDETSSLIGAWIHFDISDLILKSGQAEKIKFTLKVPKDVGYGIYEGGIAGEKTKQDIQNPNLTIATRIVQGIEVKVTNDPQIIPKKFSTTFSWYVWGSAVFFAISLGLLIWSLIMERKKKRSLQD